MVIHGEGRERRAACNSLTQGEETGRARGDRAFHQGQKSERKERGTGGEVGRSQEEKWDGAAAEHFKGTIKDIIINSSTYEG